MFRILKHLVRINCNTVMGRTGRRFGSKYGLTVGEVFHCNKETIELCYVTHGFIAHWCSSSELYTQIWVKGTLRPSSHTSWWSW